MLLFAALKTRSPLKSNKYSAAPTIHVKEPITSAFTKKNPTKERLYVYQTGQGTEPVILLHDLASTHMYWFRLIKQLNTQQFKILAPDLLGHGRSPKSPLLDYSLPSHLYYLKKDVMEGWCLDTNTKLVAGPAHVIGQGMGSMLAMELAAAFPHLVKTLTLIDLPCYKNVAEAKAFQPWIGHVCYRNRSLCLLTTIFFRWTCFFWFFVVTILGSRPVKVSIDSMIHTTQITFESYQKILIRHQVDGSVALLRTPMAILHGEHNTIIPVANIENFHKRHSKVSQLYTFDSGHDLPLFHTRHVAIFLNQNVLK